MKVNLLGKIIDAETTESDRTILLKTNLVVTEQIRVMFENMDSKINIQEVDSTYFFKDCVLNNYQGQWFFTYEDKLEKFVQDDEFLRNLKMNIISDVEFTEDQVWEVCKYISSAISKTTVIAPEFMRGVKIGIKPLD